MAKQLLLTCEHGGNRVPAAYRSIFQQAASELASHRGWDPGALSLAKTFQQRLAAPMFYSTTTRLLTEPNRSLGHQQLFSEFTSGLDSGTKQRILARYYHPHRQRVESWVAAQLESGESVIHISLHTFTPRLQGEVRRADIGLLYDPKHGDEARFCHAWRGAIQSARSDLQVRRNYPYLGKADGLTTFLRRRFGSSYAGIELEVNQRWLAESSSAWRQLRHDLATACAFVWKQATFA